MPMKIESHLPGLMCHPKGAAPVLIPWSKLRWRLNGLALLPEGELFLHPRLPRWAFLNTKAERLARVHRTRSLHHQFRGGRLHLSASIREPWWAVPSFSFIALAYFLGFFIWHGAHRKWVAGPSAFIFEGEPAAFGIMLWLLLPMTVFLICSFPLLPVIMMRHRIAWKYHHRRANRLDADSSELRAVHATETIASYPWRQINSIGLHGMEFGQLDGHPVWVPFPTEQSPMYFREIARFALRGGRKQEAAKPRLSRWRYFVGLGCILGAVCFSESVNRWLIARGGEFPPGQRVAGWAGVVIVLALWSALFLVDCLRVRASPKQRRRMRRMKAILG